MIYKKERKKKIVSSDQLVPFRVKQLKGQFAVLQATSQRANFRNKSDCDLDFKSFRLEVNKVCCLNGKNRKIKPQRDELSRRSLCIHSFIHSTQSPHDSRAPLRSGSSPATLVGYTGHTATTTMAMRSSTITTSIPERQKIIYWVIRVFFVA